MKKVIILSCSTGQGHNSCARALQEYFWQQGVACDVCDALAFLSKGFAKLISWGHSCMYRHFPGLFRWGYCYSEAHQGVFRQGSWVCKLLTVGANRLYRHLVLGRYDTVLCTHVFSAIMVSQLLRRRPLAVETGFVATDYTDYPGMESCPLGRCFIAGESLTEVYAQRGVPRETIVPTGIPVRQDFFEKLDKAEAKRQLRLREEDRHLLVMCGSMGCGPIRDILGHLAAELPRQVHVTVICGTNQRLYRQLNRRYGANSRIHLVGYTHRVSLYMDAADLYVTKPGGISVTEAAAKHLPMLFVDAVAGCEEYNMEFFLRRGCAATAGTPEELARLTLRLLGDEEERKGMEGHLAEYRQPNGAERIYRELARRPGGREEPVPLKGGEPHG